MSNQKSVMCILLCILTVAFANVVAQAEEYQIINTKLEDNLSIDAIVITPDIPHLSASVIEVRLTTPDVYQLKDILISDATVIREQTYEEYENYKQIECDGDRGIVSSPGYIFLWTPAGDVVRQLDSFGGLAEDESLDLPDLSFASRNEIVERIATELDTIGIKNAECNAVYAQPVDRLQFISDRMLSDASNQEDINAGRIPSKRNWGVIDECYILHYEFVVDSIPVFAQDDISGSAVAFGMNEIHYLSSSMEIVVSTDGVISLTANNAMEEISRKAPQELLPADQIPGFVADYYKNLSILNPTVIREIALKYILLPTGKAQSFELIPAWCCKVITQCEDGDASEWLAFDARDGSIRYGFNSSHAVCVALDSLYGAWLKAHYPLEYYTTLLSGYAAKGDKDRIALVKEEMQRGFGIRVAPCRFRQDNRDFYIDHAGNTISDA